MWPFVRCLGIVHRNRENGFAKKKFTEIFVTKCLSMYLLKRCQHGCWLCPHTIGVVVDYADTKSVWSLSTLTPCQHSSWLCGRCVSIVIDFKDTWQDSYWLRRHTDYADMGFPVVNDYADTGYIIFTWKKKQSNKSLNWLFSKIVCTCTFMYSSHCKHVDSYKHPFPHQFLKNTLLGCCTCLIFFLAIICFFYILSTLKNIFGLDIDYISSFFAPNYAYFVPTGISGGAE